MPNWKNIVLVLCILFTSSTCRKKLVPDAERFEEDPSTTKISVDDRLSGTWVINDFTFNGNSIFDKLNKTTVVHPILDNVSLFYQKANKDRNNEAFFLLKPNGFAEVGGIDTISLRSQGGDTSICYSLVSPFHKNSGFSTSYWKITKLFELEFNIKMQTDSGTYKIFWKLRSR